MAIPLPIDRDSLLIEPPIVDFLHLDLTRRAYVVTFVPEDSVSCAETEVIEVPEASSEGQRIALQLSLLAAHMRKGTAPIDRISHSGGGDFEFHFRGKPSRSLSHHNQSAEATHQAYRCLQDIAMTAQVAFILRQRSQQPVV